MLFVFTPSSYLLISSAISSIITVAYISTESTPPCLMLSLIFISLVLPYFVFIVAVRLVFMSFVICQFSVSIPLLFSTYSSASSHALFVVECGCLLFVHILFPMLLDAVRYTSFV